MPKGPGRPVARTEVRSSTRIQRGLEERRGWWDRVLELSLMWAVLAVVGCTWLLLPRVGTRLPNWEPGDVAAFDIMVPMDLTVPDEAATEAVREEARAAVLPVYDLEPRVQVELEQHIDSLFLLCRQLALEDDFSGAAFTGLGIPVELSEAMRETLVESGCSEGLQRALVDVSAQLYRVRIVDDARALERRGENGVALRNLSTGVEQRATIGDFSAAVDLRSDLESAVRERLLAQDLSRSWVRPAVEFLVTNMVPSLVFNRAETDARVREAAAQVAPRSQNFRKGQILIRRGDTVSFAVARTLRIVNRERRDLVALSSLFGVGLMMVLVIVGWWTVARELSGGNVMARNRLSMIFILMLLFIGLNRLGVFVASAVALNSQGSAMSVVDAYLWGLPFAAGAITALLLFGAPTAALFAVVTSLAAGLLLGGDFQFVVYSLVSALVGIFSAQRYRDRSGLSRVALAVGLANLVCFGILQVYGAFQDPPAVMALGAVFALAGGALTVMVVNFALPLLEGLFGITTDIRLLELSNQNLPLLKRLSLEAPGTFQHSLAVGNLAEAGADAVGANGLLLRVCSYYHDLGKLVKPEYFVENQRGFNPHDTLSPSMSALVIQSHVKEGLEMARREKLPLPIRQAVATHHGTKLIRYFFNKAKEQSDPGVQEVRESNYRYPGPKPHTKELGILLLADAVEAAARTLENPSPTKIQSMINRIFTDALEDGQLDDSELTFSEMDKVASAFLWVLTNMYHHRIDYPGFDFNRRQNKRDSGAVQLGAKTVAGER